MAAVGAYSLHCCKMEVTLSIIDKLDPTVQLVAEIAVNCSVFLFFFFSSKRISQPLHRVMHTAFFITYRINYPSYISTKHKK